MGKFSLILIFIVLFSSSFFLFSYHGENDIIDDIGDQVQDEEIVSSDFVFGDQLSVSEIYSLNRDYYNNENNDLRYQVSFETQHDEDISFLYNRNENQTSIEVYLEEDIYLEIYSPNNEDFYYRRDGSNRILEGNNINMFDLVENSMRDITYEIESSNSKEKKFSSQYGSIVINEGIVQSIEYIDNEQSLNFEVFANSDIEEPSWFSERERFVNDDKSVVTYKISKGSILMIPPSNVNFERIEVRMFDENFNLLNEDHVESPNFNVNYGNINIINIVESELLIENTIMYETSSYEHYTVTFYNEEGEIKEIHRF